LTVLPDNIIYHPYEIKLSDILEIWEYVAHIGQNDALQESPDQTQSMLRNLMLELQDIKKGIGKA